MNILILGAGYIGLALLSTWSGEDDHFTVTTTTESKLESLRSLPNVDEALVLLGSDEARLKDLLPQFDGVVVSLAPSSGRSYEETYLKTARALKAALSDRQTPLTLVYTSSTSVYGQQEGAVLDEESERMTQSDKGKILCQAEDCLLSCESSMVSVCVLRLGGIYGPERSWEQRAQRLSGRTIPGKDDVPTNSIHAEDIARAIHFCFKKRLSGIYNLVNDDHRSRGELYAELCGKLGIQPPSWDSTNPSVHGSNAVVSNKKIVTSGFTFMHSSIEI